jgi:hypothetical protein
MMGSLRLMLVSASELGKDVDRQYSHAEEENDPEAGEEEERRELDAQTRKEDVGADGMEAVAGRHGATRGLDNERDD